MDARKYISEGGCWMVHRREAAGWYIGGRLGSERHSRDTAVAFSPALVDTRCVELNN